jgi:hypothetical protein
MRIALNPFWVFVLVAVVVLFAIVMISNRRNETRILTPPNEPGVSGPSVPATIAVLLALAVILVPFGIAIAALWGPSVGIVAYFALFTAGLIGLAVSRRSRGSGDHARHDRA